MKVDQSSVDDINKKLAERFGLCYDGRPVYRITWGPDEMEFREGLFPFFGLNDKQVVTHAMDIRCVPKYRGFEEGYILEKLVPRIMPEVKGNDKLYYEICMPLPRNKPPYWEGINFFLTLGQITTEEEEKAHAEKFFKKLEKEEGDKEIDAYQYAMEILNDESDPSFRNAVSVSNFKPNSFS